MRFIVLTFNDGKKVRINIQHIVSYYVDNNSTTIELYREVFDDTYYVKETPEEIDTILINNSILVHAKDN